MNTIPVFFRSEQSVPEVASFSRSAGKPALVMQDWLGHEQIAPSLDVRSFEPVTVKQLCLAHSPGYVNGVLKGYVNNGFGDKDPAVAASLPYTVGSIVAAAEHVLTIKSLRPFKVAVSPTSGFHHAGHGFGGGFCTFNGLMVAAINAYQKGLAKRILILDFDAHYGDGTEEIIRRLGIDFVTNITAEKSYTTSSELLERAGRQLMDRQPGYYDLVLYQAGADAWKEDPLGGLLTLDELRQRDWLVFQSCLMRKTPVVVNLAGGYSTDAEGTIEPVLKIHRQTMLECIRLKTM